MTKLWLVFTDENGEEKRVEVDRLPFVIGRHSGTDLPITDGRLSREHVRIEQQMDKFVVSDAGSTNGTLLNGEDLLVSAALRNGDVLDVAGAVQMTVLFEEAEPDGAGDGAAPVPVDPDVLAPAATTATTSLGHPSETSTGGIPTALFFIAPVLGIFVLAVVILGIVLFGGGKDQVEVSRPDDYGYSDNDDSQTNADDESSTPKPSRSNMPNSSETPLPYATPVGSSPTPGGTGPPTDTDGSNATAVVEQNGAAFVRQIALNDPKAFLTGEQAARVNAKIKQFGRSSTLADNLGSARKNASALRTLAQQKNLTPQFLAVAAMTKLGNSRGDVLQAAQSVVETYGQLRIQIGNENFDEALLMVAAYDQGAAGETMKMRNMLQDLSTKSSEGARTIRSIWFLEKNGKITPAEFERALNFLAIGTIAQNPKAFGVNAEALKM